MSRFLRRWLASFVLSLVVALSFEGLASGYSNDPSEIANRQKTAQGIAPLQIDLGGTRNVQSELPFWKALFATFENPNVEMPAPIDLRKQGIIAGVFRRCIDNDEFLKARGRGLSSLAPEARVAVERLLELYAYLVVQERPDLVVLDGPCDSISVPPSFVRVTTLGRVVSAARLDHLPADVATEIERLRTTFGAKAEDLLTMYLLATYGHPFAMDTREVQTALGDHCPQGFCQPIDILRQKTTPSLAANNRLSGVRAGSLSWDVLGMNAYWESGHTPIFGWVGRKTAWVGKATYEHPILSRLVPVLGASIEAADALHSVWEGRDANGVPQHRLYSAAIFTMNYIFAVADTPLIKGMATGSYNGLKSLKSAARRARTAEEATQLTKEASNIVRTIEAGTPELHAGREAVREAYALGVPDDEVLNLGVPALLSTAADQAVYSQRMHHLGLQMAARAAHARQPFDAVVGIIRLASRRTMRPIKRDAWRDFGRIKSAARFDDTVHWLKTPVSERYAQPELWDEVKNWVERNPRRTESARMFQNVPPNDVVPPGSYRQIEGTIDGERIPLTLVVKYDKPLLTEKNVATHGMLIHWHPRFAPDSLSVIQKVDREMERLYAIAMTSTNRGEIIDTVAEMHWWYANLTPYVRGSNGITDALAATILKARGIRRGRYRAGVSPDFKAFARTKEEFVRDYRTFFERDPSLPPPTLWEPPPTFASEPLTRYPAPLVPGGPPAGIAGKLSAAQFGSRKVVGWAADPSTADAELYADPLSSDAEPRLPDLFHFRISVRSVDEASCAENEVASLWATAPSRDVPGMDPKYLNELGKTTHGFEYEVPPSLERTHLRFYAVHPILSDQVRYLGERKPGGAPGDADPDAGPPPPSEPSPAPQTCAGACLVTSECLPGETAWGTPVQIPEESCAGSSCYRPTFVPLKYCAMDCEAGVYRGRWHEPKWPGWIYLGQCSTWWYDQRAGRLVDWPPTNCGAQLNGPLSYPRHQLEVGWSAVYHPLASWTQLCGDTAGDPPESEACRMGRVATFTPVDACSGEVGTPTVAAEFGHDLACSPAPYQPRLCEGADPHPDASVPEPRPPSCDQRCCPTSP